MDLLMMDSEFRQNFGRFSELAAFVQLLGVVGKKGFKCGRENCNPKLQNSLKT